MGCNIVITEKGFTREYFGDDAFYCEPGDPESIYNAVENAAQSDCRIALQQKILTPPKRALCCTAQRARPSRQAPTEDDNVRPQEPGFPGQQHQPHPRQCHQRRDEGYQAEQHLRTDPVVLLIQRAFPLVMGRCNAAPICLPTDLTRIGSVFYPPCMQDG